MQTRRGKSTRASSVGVRASLVRLMAAEALGPPDAYSTLLDSRSELTRPYVLKFLSLAIVLKAAVTGRRTFRDLSVTCFTGCKHQTRGGATSECHRRTSRDQRVSKRNLRERRA